MQPLLRHLKTGNTLKVLILQAIILFVLFFSVETNAQVISTTPEEIIIACSSVVEEIVSERMAFAQELRKRIEKAETVDELKEIFLEGDDFKRLLSAARDGSEFTRQSPERFQWGQLRGAPKGSFVCVESENLKQIQRIVGEYKLNLRQASQLTHQTVQPNLDDLQKIRGWVLEDFDALEKLAELQVRQTILEEMSPLMAETLILLGEVGDLPVELVNLYPDNARPAWVKVCQWKRISVWRSSVDSLIVFIPSVEATNRYMIRSDGSISFVVNRYNAVEAYKNNRSLIEAIFLSEWQRRGASPVQMDIICYDTNPWTGKFELDVDRYTLTRQPDGEGTGESNQIKMLSLEQMLKTLEELDAFLAVNRDFVGAEWDEENSQFLLYARADTPELPPITLSDIAVAYRAVFYHNLEGAFVDMDPGAAYDEYRVSFGGWFDNTRLGEILLNTDILFKTLINAEHPQTGESYLELLRERMPIDEANPRRGFRTQMERLLDSIRESGDSAQAGYEQRRFWFYPDNVRIAVGPNGKVIAIENSQMTAKAEKTVDGTVKPLPVDAQEFLAHLNKYYDEYVEVFPELKGLHNAARLIVLFRTLKQLSQNEQPNLSALLAIPVEFVQTSPTYPVKTFPYELLLSTHETDEGYLQQYARGMIEGGVDLHSFNKRNWVEMSSQRRNDFAELGAADERNPRVNNRAYHKGVVSLPYTGNFPLSANRNRLNLEGQPPSPLPFKIRDSFRSRRLRSLNLIRNRNVIVVNEMPLEVTAANIREISAAIPEVVLCHRVFRDKLYIQIAANGKTIEPVEVELRGKNIEKMSTEQRRDLLNPEALRERLAGYSKVIIGDGELQINFNEIFPEKKVMRTYELNQEQIQQNLKALREVHLTPKNTGIFIAVPTETEEWKQVRKEWQDTVKEFGYSEQEASKEEIGNALSNRANVAIIIAHSDGYSIVLPNGERVYATDLSSYKDAMQKNRPTVLLFACESAKIKDLEPFAKGLLQLGAKAVIAPTVEISAKRSLEFFRRLLELSRENIPLIDALGGILEKIDFPHMELWLSKQFDTVKFKES